MEKMVTSVREELVERIGFQAHFENPAKGFAGGWVVEKEERKTRERKREG